MVKYFILGLIYAVSFNVMLAIADNSDQDSDDEIAQCEAKGGVIVHRVNPFHREGVCVKVIK